MTSTSENWLHVNSGQTHDTGIQSIQLSQSINYKDQFMFAGLLLLHWGLDQAKKIF